jgi:uncharacterized surface protein with fasciclin (FAS1) repeats
LPPDVVARLFTDAGKDDLIKILKAHVVSGKVDAATVKTLKEVETIGGSKFAVTAGDKVMIGSATVVMADVMATNGIIHVVDTVIVP